MEENLPALPDTQLFSPNDPPEEEVLPWEEQIVYSGDSVEEWVQVEKEDLRSLDDWR